MKIKEVIQRVQNLYSKGVNSDDSRLSNRHIYNKLISARAKLISQKVKKKQRISQWNYQSLPCIKLIQVPKHMCPCIPPIGCMILRSEEPLPKPISGFSEELIQFISSIDGKIRLDRITLNAINYQKGNKYTSTKTNFFIQDGYLYITVVNSLEVVSLSGIFEDPIEAINFKSYCEQDCKDCVKCIDYMEEEFPIDSDMLDTIVELAVNELVILFSKNIEDVTNNTTDSIKEQSK